MTIDEQPTLVPIEQLPQTDQPKKAQKPSVNILGTILKEQMEKHGHKIADVSRGSGVPYSTLWDWLDGKVKAQILDKDVLAVARFYNISIEYLAFGIGDDEPAFGKFNGKAMA